VHFHKTGFLQIIALDIKAKIVTISSGKGGVGKTCTSVNLAILLAQQGYKVCLFDADANLANVNIMLKLAPKHTLEHVISGQKTLNDITLNKAGIQIIPGASGLNDFISLNSKQQQRLLSAMQELKTKYDYLIIDNPAGISENVLSFIKFSDYGIIVITPEPTSLTDAFALIRVLQKRGNQKKLNVIINNVSNKVYAYGIFKRFLAAVEKHIGSQLNYLGYVVSDELITKSICLQTPVVLHYPASPSARNFKELSTKLISLQEQKLSNKPQPSVQKNPTKQQPDFSTNAASLNKQIKSTFPQTQSLSIEELKIELINNINDKSYEQAKLKEIVQQINNTYLKRFGDYIVDLPLILHDAIKMDRISKTTMQNLIVTLHGLYQDQYGIPFEVKITPTPDTKESNLKYETIELLINLLQQENPSNPQTLPQSNSKAVDNKGPKLVPPITSPHNANQDLIDSIRYASLVDKL